MEQIPRRQYTAEFKREAVKLVLEQGVGIREAARRLDFEGWLHLACILDLYSRRVVGWATSPRLDRKLVINAFGMAYFRTPPAARSDSFTMTAALNIAVPTTRRCCGCTA